MLDIAAIHARSPQAKGRVERANKTLQDRLVKEMRLRGINSLEAGNAYLPEFMADFNRRFAVAPRNPEDAHRAVLRDAAELDLIFCEHHRRKLTKNLTINPTDPQQVFLLEKEKGPNRKRGHFNFVLTAEQAPPWLAIAVPAAVRRAYLRGLFRPGRDRAIGHDQDS